ncbi:MAG: hypothetical protein IPP91_14180 [Betaproteobacteria bacterium]|nr:hypothetical protein [Betaproteobacteria bacterium]
MRVGKDESEQAFDDDVSQVARLRGLRVSQPALARLMSYDYPGNVRELRNLLERASVMCDGEVISAEHLPDHVRASAGTQASMPSALSGDGAQGGGTATLRAIEADLLRSRVATHRGTRKELARMLGVSERTLYRKLTRIAPPE